MNKKGTPQNLKPYKKGEERAKINGSKGGKVSINARNRLKEILLEVRKMETETGKKVDSTYLDQMIYRMVNEAQRKGNVNAFTALWDRGFGKPPQPTIELDPKSDDPNVFITDESSEDIAQSVSEMLGIENAVAEAKKKRAEKKPTKKKTTRKTT